MGFRFKRKEAVPDGLRRLATERVEAALDSLQDFRRPKAVHGVRKDIKKIRAVLRMARGQMPKKAYRRQSDLLRKAAQQLAPTRDAFVVSAALDDLRERFRGQFRTAEVQQVQRKMESALTQAKERFSKKGSARKVQRLLKRIPDELDELDFQAKGWSAIAPGLKSAYERGQKTLWAARENPSPELLHEWRKRAKDLWYQLRVLRPIAPERLGSMTSDLKNLTEFLGDDHDLFLLEQKAGSPSNGQQELFGHGALREMIGQRRRELQAAAFRLGQEFYAEKPSLFCRRIAQHWRAWRDGAKAQ